MSNYYLMYFLLRIGESKAPQCAPPPSTVPPPYHRLHNSFLIRREGLSFEKVGDCRCLAQGYKSRFLVSLSLLTLGVFHYAIHSGNFGRKSNGKVCFGFFPTGIFPSPLEVVHLVPYSDRNSPYQFIALRLCREFVKGIKNCKSHSSWLARFDRIPSGIPIGL